MLAPSLPSPMCRLISDINKRITAYSDVSDRCQFLRNSTEMEVMELREMQHAAETLYSSDLDDTLTQFGRLVAETLTGDLEQEVSPEATMYVSYVDQEKSQGCFLQCGGIPSHVSDFDYCGN